MLTLLNDKKNYSPVKKSRVKAIEKIVNKFISSLKLNIIKNDKELNKLMVSGTKPANFFAAVKDHKPMDDEGNWPLRPIASVHGTPVDKIDWILSKIILQVLPFVKSHLSSTISLLEKLDDLNEIKLSGYNNNSTKISFISLDVVAMYPSINLTTGIPVVVDFIKQHMNNIDTLGMTEEQIKNGLSILCYNYEIEFDGSVFRQIKGVPMGTRFAPPFSIIFLNYIEQKALQTLKQFDILSCIFVRYIDDILLGVFDITEDKCKIILDCFNNVDPDIQFTIEKPNKLGYITYLDISIRTKEDGKVEYVWFQKEFHSKLCLNRRSYIPSAMKHNFIKNRIDDISRRCNSEETRELSIEYFKNILIENGHKLKNEVIKIKKKKKKIGEFKINERKHNTVILKLPFLSDNSWRKIRKTISKLKLDVNLVMEKRKPISKICKPNFMFQCFRNCLVCEQVSKHFNCHSRFVVYSFICKLCVDKTSEYIGETCVWIIDRIKQHQLSIKNRDSKSALSTHLKDIHPNETPSINHFRLQIKQKCKDSHDTCIAEAIWIEREKPSLNRKYELNNYNLDYK